MRVLKGTFLCGHGRNLRRDQALNDERGEFRRRCRRKCGILQLCKGETIVQVHGAGPFKVNFVNPADVIPPDAPAGRREAVVLGNTLRRSESVKSLREGNRTRNARALETVARLCVRLNIAVREIARLPERGASGSVQRGPANPARPGREQRYRERLGCRRSPEVPRDGRSAHRE